MPDACYCGVDSSATCVRCGERRCPQHYLLSADSVGAEGVVARPAGPAQQVLIRPSGADTSEDRDDWCGGGPGCIRCRDAAMQRGQQARRAEAEFARYAKQERLGELEAAVASGIPSADDLKDLARWHGDGAVTRLVAPVLRLASERGPHRLVDVVAVQVAVSGERFIGSRRANGAVTARHDGILIAETVVDLQGTTVLALHARADTEGVSWLGPRSDEGFTLAAAPGGKLKFRYVPMQTLPRVDHSVDESIGCSACLGRLTPATDAELRTALERVAPWFS